MVVSFAETTGGRRMSDDRQGPQLARSATRVFGLWLWSPQGRYVFNLIERTVLVTFVAFAAWNASTEHSVTQWRSLYADMAHKTYEATIQNRCVGWAILAKVDKKRYTLPVWCQGPLDQLATEPPDMPEIPTP